MADLVIPIRFDPSKAAQGLAALQAQTNAATAQTTRTQTQGAKDAAKAQVEAAKDAAKLVEQTQKDLAAKTTTAAKDALAKQTDAAKDAAEKQAEAAKAAASAKKKADQDTFAVWKHGMDAQHTDAMAKWEQQQKGIKATRDEMAHFAKAMFGLGAARAVVATITQQMNLAAEYTRNAAKEFVVLRKTMQEVANLRGKPGSNEFTIEEAEKAVAAHLTPEVRRDFQAEFLNYAGAQIGGPEGKLTEAQGEDYGNRIALMMQESGIAPKIGAELGGSILEQSRGPQDVNTLMQHFTKAFEVLQKGRVPLQRALPEISQIMSYGISPEEAAKMFAIVSPAASGEEGTSVRAALRATQEMQNKGTGEEFGVTQSQTKYEAVQAFARNIQQRKNAFQAQGMSETLAQNKVEAELMEKGIAADSREARGLVRGFGGQGIGLGAFARYEAVEAATPADFEQKKKEAYLASPAGRQTDRDAAAALADVQSGGRNVRIAELLQEAETQLKNERRFEIPTLGDAFRATTGAISGVPVRQQLINERAAQLAQEGLPEDQRVKLETTATNLQANQLILQALNLQTKLMQEAAERDKRRGQPAPPPMSAPPPVRTGGVR